MAIEFYRPLYNLVGGFVGKEWLKRKEKKPVDINKPGMLLHGIENLPPEAALQIVLSEGLKPSNEQQYRSHIYSLSPNRVCLAMVGKGGFKYSTAAAFGADEKTSSEYISVVVNPEYVRAHANEFRAVGACFNSRHPNGEEYRKAMNKLYKGMRRTPALVGFFFSGSPFDDEVRTKFIPPEAIVGVIAKQKRIGSVQETLRYNFPQRKITVYDVEGNIQN